MNKAMIDYIKEEVSTLRVQLFDRVEKLAIRKKAHELSIDEKWTLFLRALNQSILPFRTDICMSEYTKTQFLKSYFDFSSYEYPADIDEKFMHEEKKFINETTDAAIRNCILNEKEYPFTEVFPKMKAMFDEHYSLLE